MSVKVLLDTLFALFVYRGVKGVKGMSVLLKMTGIEKRFGNVTVLKNGQLQVNKGEVHALLGVNGAGKSTMIKILSGIHSHDAGDLILEGKIKRFKTPREAKVAGIFTVYQEVDTAIIPDLQVSDNVMIDTFSTMKGIKISQKNIEKQAKEALALLEAANIDVTKNAFELTLAEKQLVLIARALIQDAKLIIFDEPTAPLSVKEANQLFDVVRKLKGKGVASIFITHRLHEVFEICDAVTVMRDGQHVISKQIEHITQTEIIESMLGESFYLDEKKPVQQTLGDVVFEAQHVSDGRKVHDVSFQVRVGEVVGIVGLVGAGKTELANVLIGKRKKTNGAIEVKRKKVAISHPKKAIAEGIVLIPEERRKEGLFIEESVRVNASFPNLTTFSVSGFMKKALETDFSHSIIKRLGIKTYNAETSLHYLSGGNQQKVAIGKWLSLNPHVYMFDEPTKGVDIGAKMDIFETIQQLASEDKGIIYFSSEISEILYIADTIYVMYDGRLVKKIARSEATQEQLLFVASGGKEE